jgi:hypothetical protein
MANWSTKRKYGYFLLFIILILVILVIPGYFLFYEKPTCFDGRQNANERGVDCGGDCAKLCPADFVTPKVLWSYSMKVAPSIYNALAYVQNPNQFVEALSLPYLLRLYDAEGVLIAERRGLAYVPAGQKFAIFEGGINTGVRTPVKTTFEWSSEPVWRPAEAFTKLKVDNIIVEEGERPKAEVKVFNTSPINTYSNINAFIVLYDKNDNRVAFSKTLIDKIGKEELKSLYFTWPSAFSADIVRSEALFVLRNVK